MLASSHLDLEQEENPAELPSKRTDPFAKREGKTLVWSEVNMTLAGKGEEPDRKLLSGVWGEVPQDKTTAIMVCIQCCSRLF